MSTTIDKVPSKIIKPTSPQSHNTIYLYISIVYGRPWQYLWPTLTIRHRFRRQTETTLADHRFWQLIIVVGSRHIDIRRVLASVLHRIAHSGNQRRRWQNGRQIDRSQGWLCQWRELRGKGEEEKSLWVDWGRRPALLPYVSFILFPRAYPSLYMYSSSSFSLNHTLKLHFYFTQNNKELNL